MPSSTINIERLKSTLNNINSQNIHHQPSWANQPHMQQHGMFKSTRPLMNSRTNYYQNPSQNPSTRSTLMVVAGLLGGAYTLESLIFQYQYPQGERYQISGIEPVAEKEQESDGLSLDQQTIRAYSCSSYLSKQPNKQTIWKHLHKESSGRITPETFKISDIERHYDSIYLKRTYFKDPRRIIKYPTKYFDIIVQPKKS